MLYYLLSFFFLMGISLLNANNIGAICSIDNFMQELKKDG